jgi:type I restriction enzyme, S subunit|nr:restriction endonuclease subunit S [uncultured Romboutsia sp.]
MLLKEFSTIFDRPEKVKKLREYILSLAVRGKLVKQDENDEPASVLLDRIREEKDRVVKEKKIKKEKQLTEISEDEIPYELPKGWEWVRIGDIVSFNIGKTPNRKNSAYWENGIYPWVSISDMEHGKVIFNTKQKVSQIGVDECFKGMLSPKGTLLMSFKLTIGKMSILGMDALHNEAIVSIYPYIDEMKLFLFKLLNGFELTSGTKDAIMGKTLNSKSMKNILIALPPLNEQKRIVEKLDYLMEFCDKLEEQLEKQVKYGSLSVKSVLNGVSNCSSYEELEEALRFIIENFKDLTLADGAVGELKNAVLSLAVKGKLVPQDESDEPASALLERIREEKDSLVKEKKIKKENPLLEISEDEIPYELPKGWKWIRMRELAQNIHYGYTASAKTDNTGVKFVRITDIQNNMVNWETVPYCDIDDKKLESCKLENNDILIARTGGTIGKSFIVENVEYSAVFASYLIRVIPLKSINPRYLKLFLETPLYWRQLISKSQGTGQPNVNSVSLSELVMPLPSINEQERIIDRVEKLMKVCDELELRIEKSKKYSGKLMESILKNSFKA